MVAYFCVLLLLAPINLLSFDTYYYWAWSRHLAMSYYDGSPMIAYFIKSSTWLFGDTLFALSLVGVVTAGFTSWIIYKAARLFLTQNASYVAMTLWLFSPLVTGDILRQTTYDTPLTIFWALTLYFVASWITSPQTKTLYAIGVSIGLMLLSKYSGCVLVLSLLVFLCASPYRNLFKNSHFYLAIGVALILFSPVILWNEQHGWQSFSYQLTSHGAKDSQGPWAHVLKSFVTVFLPSLNFMLLPTMICWRKRATDAKDLVKMCMIVCTTFFVFYGLLSSVVALREYWLTPYLISSALLGGYCFEHYAYRKSVYGLLAVYLVLSLGILVNNTTLFHVTSPAKWRDYEFIHAINRTFPHSAKVVVTSGWLEARMLFFLKDKPNVYTVGCGSPENQYALWSAPVISGIKDKSIKAVWYIDKVNHISCVNKLFDHCEALLVKEKMTADDKRYAYLCTND